jgi:hypothetical protein
MCSPCIGLAHLAQKLLLVAREFEDLGILTDLRELTEDNISTGLFLRQLSVPVSCMLKLSDFSLLGCGC